MVCGDRVEGTAARPRLASRIPRRSRLILLSNPERLFDKSPDRLGAIGDVHLSTAPFVDLAQQIRFHRYVDTLVSWGRISASPELTPVMMHIRTMLSGAPGTKSPKKRPSLISMSLLALINERVNVPMEPDLLREIDEWRRQQPDIPNRAEAIRRLVKRALGIAEKDQP